MSAADELPGGAQAPSTGAALGGVLFDLLKLAMALVLLGGATWATMAADRALAAAGAAAPARAAAAVVVWPAALLALIWVMARIVPPPRFGRHRVGRSLGFFQWAYHLTILYCVTWHPLRELILHSAVLRYLFLRAGRCRIAFTATLAPNVELCDVWALRIGPGAFLGFKVSAFGHFMERGWLHIHPVSVGAGAQVGGGCLLLPGAVVEEGAAIGQRAMLYPAARVGAGARVGAQARVWSGAVIEEGARIGNAADVGGGARVSAGARVADHERVAPGALVSGAVRDGRPSRRAGRAAEERQPSYADSPSGVT